MLTPENMDHLCALARLAPTEATRTKFGEQCADILAYMDVLSEVDTKDVPPLYSPVRHIEGTRPDVAEKRRQRSDVLSNAPESDGEFFIVPRIV